MHSVVCLLGGRNRSRSNERQLVSRSYRQLAVVRKKLGPTINPNDMPPRPRILPITFYEGGGSKGGSYIYNIPAFVKVRG